MDTIKLTQKGFDKRTNEWLQTLSAYEQELTCLQQTTNNTAASLLLEKEIHQIQSEIIMQKNVVNDLNHEISQSYTRSLCVDSLGYVTMNVLVENNRLRDKIRKTGQAIFLLKFKTNQLLSNASL